MAANTDFTDRFLKALKPDFYSDKIIGSSGSYAVNHPVQWSSAEVMMIALTRLDKALPR